MIVVDTSGVLAYMDRSSTFHDACVAALAQEPGPFLLSPFVLAELDYLLAGRLGQDAELALLAEVARGAYRLEPMTGDDVANAASVIRRHADLRLGLADASLTVLAARHRVGTILTLDQRHFRALRRLDDGREFTLLPADRPHRHGRR